MKFYVIPPVNELELMRRGTAGAFCLAHLYLTNQKYKQWFLDFAAEIAASPETGKQIILDNSAAERSVVSVESLIEITAELKPTYVIPPDHLYNCDRTIANFEQFVGLMEDRGLFSHTKILACPQGSTKEEWIECYTYMASHRMVSRIGLSKISVPYCFRDSKYINLTPLEFVDMDIAGGRNECMAYLKEMNFLIKPIHLLGMGDPNEYNAYVGYPNVENYTTDSCYSIWAGMNNKAFVFDGSENERIPTPHDYFDLMISPGCVPTITRNIDLLENLLKNVK